MTKRMMRLRKVLILGLSLGTLFSCEEDFQNIGVGIVDNNRFDTDKYVSEVVASTVAIERLNASGLELQNQKLDQYLLGVYNSETLGKLEGSLISQVYIPGSVSRYSTLFGADTTIVSTIDTVILNIPFQYSLDGNHENGSTKYKIDSIIGNQDAAFNLKVYELDTYLNRFDPTNPSEVNVYYSDKEYSYSTLLNGSTDYSYTFNTLDTIEIVKRRTYDTGVVYATDTLNADGPIPLIRIALDKDYFDEHFVQKFDDPEFASQDAFQDYFRGLYIEATGDDGALLSLPFDGAVLSVYYTNTAIDDLTGQPVDTIKKSTLFSLAGIRANNYTRSAAPAADPNNLYVAGAAGNEVSLKLFGEDTDNNGVPDELEELRTKDWILNEASLSFYVDTDVYNMDQDSIPYRMFMYREIEDEGVQTLDMMTQGDAALYGYLERDSISDFWRYKLRITNYITDLMSAEPTQTLNDLRLKIISTSDIPNFVGDSIVEPFNWTGKGVVLHGPNSSDEEKRLKLEIYYSKLNTEED
ncbi:MAG: DUF4270 domain-containing protein [Flavobacteriaceae bacterium]